MKKPIGLIATSIIVVLALVGCSTSSISPQPNSQLTNTQNQTTIGNSQSQTNTNNGIGTSSTPTPTAPSAQPTDATTALLLNMVQLAQQGKIYDFDFPTKFSAKTTNIETVEEYWGKPDQTNYVAAAKGTYVTYSSHNIVFGLNKGGQIFEIRSLATNQFTGITVAKVKEVLGTPAYDTTSNGQEIIGYPEGKEFKIEMVFPQATTDKPNPSMDHYNVLYPQGTSDQMANEPGRQW